MNQQEQALFLTLYYLDDTTLSKACQVNKRFYQRVCNSIWLGRLKNNYPRVIEMFPPVIQHVTYRQQYLLLQSLNKLKQILSPLKGLTLLEIYQLTGLDLSNNQLTELPGEIGHLTNLEYLNLSKNKLINLPEEIGRLTNLQELNVSNNQLTELPKEIGQLTNLRLLYSDDNLLTELPAEIGQLAKLEELTINDNNLTGLPSEIGRLRNLEEFVINNNQLTDLPLEFWQLINFQGLNVNTSNTNINLGASRDWSVNY